MPLIAPFKPLRYNPANVNPGAVIAPPYDVISPQKRAALLASDPHNIIQLILPEGHEETKYEHGGDLLRTWIAQGTFIREQQEAIYPYAQVFTHPVTGNRIERRGFIALVRLSPFSEGKILPHERTLSGPKADRLKLMHATDANLEPIFGIYRDPSGRSSARLDDISSSAAPFIAVTDSDGVDHRLWRVSEPDEIQGYIDDLRDAKVFIVDGHHRYETALNYQREIREANPELPADAPVDYMMIFLAPSSDPGLVILPTHRVVHSLPSFDFDALLERLRENFTVRNPETREEGLEDLAMHTGTPSFLLLSNDKSALVSLRPEVRLDDVVDPSLPSPLKPLDVTVLHDHILQQLLGITAEAQAEQHNLEYMKSTEEALEAADREDVQLVAIMNPTKLAQVEQVAESGSVMPQKSTYFYPKLASGLVVREIGDMK